AYYLAEAAQCELWGKRAEDMTREELLVFLGFMARNVAGDPPLNLRPTPAPLTGVLPA
ncbi:MAG: hypothetical protein JWQ03_2227, partial [Variovorax sp.]|nr:hypothetical protein [Variovorax sp.]